MKKIIMLLALPFMLLANESNKDNNDTSALIKKTKESGLNHIPEDRAILFELINKPKNPLTEAKFILGKKLYFDSRLSKSGIISCNTCHNLGAGGVDNIPTAIGHEWSKNPKHLNSPTVYNAVFMEKQFWDGRSPDLEDQAQGPIVAGPEMAASKEHVENFIMNTPGYLKAFRDIKEDADYKPTLKDVGDMIGVFERTLITPSRYDKFMETGDDVLSKKEKKGLNLFIDRGCVSCHNGIGLGGSMQVFPVYGKYKYADIGGFEGDKNKMIKVPTLRNVVETYPYYHNGSVKTLSEAIKLMGELQLDTNLTDSEVSDIESFLNSLEGVKMPVKYPILPKTNYRN